MKTQYLKDCSQISKFMSLVRKLCFSRRGWYSHSPEFRMHFFSWQKIKWSVFIFSFTVLVTYNMSTDMERVNNPVKSSAIVSTNLISFKANSLLEKLQYKNNTHHKNADI